MDEIYEQIKNERKRQDERWGEQNHNVFVWLSILGEEVGEANKAALELEEKKRKEYCKELIQVAAVAVAAIESYQRMKHPRRMEHPRRRRGYSAGYA